MQPDMMRFYKALADDGERGSCCDCGAPHSDPVWTAQHLWEQDHPVQTCRWIGPTRPHQDLDAFERVLRDIYAPALREQINRSLTWAVHSDH